MSQTLFYEKKKVIVYYVKIQIHFLKAGAMEENLFFNQPILNSPYNYPARHWELDEHGQPTQQIVNKRRKAEFLTPIPNLKNARGKLPNKVFSPAPNIPKTGSNMTPTPIINHLRQVVDAWRELPNPKDWKVTPETARLLQHWRHHKFSGIRPFFCQVEAAEVAIWLTEVAPQSGKQGRIFLEHLENANHAANPELMRLALKLATGAGKTTVMAMLIAWQTINAVRRRASKNLPGVFL